MPERTVTSWKQQDGHLEPAVSDGVVRIQPYTEKIVETTFVPAGERYDPASHAVVLKPAIALSATAGAVREQPDGLQYDLGTLTVHVRKAPFGLSYSYRGKPLTAENMAMRSPDKASASISRWRPMK